tara:strand:+ start:9588 stop:9983 length:396 start_codon:yes stop_codon:yes gene_type:complete
MRNIQDALLTESIAVAAAGASSSTASFNLGGADDAVTEVVDLQIDLPVLPALVDTETVTLTVEDSADNSSFAALAPLATLIATGTLTPGSAAALTRKVKLLGARQYVRVTGAVSATAGDNTGVSFTAKILT